MHSILSETLSVLAINLTALLGSVFVWADFEIMVKVTVVVIDLIIAVTSIFWLMAKSKSNKQDIVNKKLEARKLELEIEALTGFEETREVE